MDRSQQQSSPQRDMVFCHECENEWYRDEHGLTCPDCGSDFTEIIEEDHDPRSDLLLPDNDSDDSHDDLGRESHDRNPWADIPDPDEGNINEFHWQTNGPGRFTVHGTFYRTVPNTFGRPGADNNQQQRAGGPGNYQEGITQNFMTMLQGILGTNGRPLNQNQPADEQPSAGNPQLHGNLHDNLHDNPQGNPLGNGSQVRTIFGGGPGHRFTYTSSARFFPRDANNPAHIEPVDDLNTLLGAMFGPDAFGQARMGQQQQQQQQQQQGAGPLPTFNPLAALFGHLLNPGGVHGDVVYSQEALDRVISQLMEQNATGNAPGPAPADAIASLPKRKITIDDLGSDGKAECSICMDDVIVGEDVTVLPCSHWFHHQCVSMWLGEHDTCPHCRQGITKPPEAGNGQAGARVNNNSQAGPSSSSSYPGSSPTNHPQPPGAFYSEGQSPRGPISPSSPFAPHSPYDQRPNTERSRSDSQGNGGIADRIRRGLFGGGSSHG